MSDASAMSFLFDGLTALHGGPLDDASGFVFYRELYGHLDGMVKRFGFDLFGRMLAWVSFAATSLLTFWVWIEGYRIVIGRSQRSMTAFLTEMVQAVTITALAAGAALGGTTLYDWVGHDLGRMVHRVLTGQTGDVFESIDRTLGYMQLAFGFIDEIQTGGSEALENAKYRNLSFVAVGMGGPAIIAGALLLTYKVMLALSPWFRALVRALPAVSPDQAAVLGLAEPSGRRLVRAVGPARHGCDRHEHDLRRGGDFLDGQADRRIGGGRQQPSDAAGWARPTVDHLDLRCACDSGQVLQRAVGGFQPVFGVRARRDGGPRQCGARPSPAYPYTYACRPGRATAGACAGACAPRGCAWTRGRAGRQDQAGRGRAIVLGTVSECDGIFGWRT